MTVERTVRAAAGLFVLASLALGTLVSPWWYLAGAFVGANLLQSAFTNWCLLEDVLKALGMRGECDERADGDAPALEADA